MGALSYAQLCLAFLWTTPNYRGNYRGPQECASDSGPWVSKLV